MQHPLISFFLVGVQFATLIYLILTSPLTLASPLAFSLFLGGVLLGLVALFVMRKSRFNTTPDVRERSLLITTGPYALIRHPMYTSVILIALGLLLEASDTARLIVFTLLCIDLNIKFRYEEYLLNQAFPETYPAYITHTKALIPFVY